MPPIEVPYSHTNRYTEVQFVGSDDSNNSQSPEQIEGESFPRYRNEGFIFNPPLNASPTQPIIHTIDLTPQMNSSHLNMKISATAASAANPFTASFFLFSKRFGSIIQSSVELITTVVPTYPLSQIITTFNSSNWFAYNSSTNTLALAIPLVGGFRGRFQSLYHLYESNILL